ncbi:MAG: hypothetical protein JW891_05025 [Candidatus Lokiarchaeota archaeon]|nr:hypothetical protein [Candidatus Lokiarchaeota archaeon]
MIENIKNVAVIGAGTMGSDLALLFALYDYDVIVCDISQNALDTLFERQSITLEELHRKKITKKKQKSLKKRFTLTQNIEDVKDVDFVLETIDEKLEEKRKLFKKLEDLVPEAVLSTNTSSLKVSDIAEGMNASDRIVLFHFSNPSITSDLAEIMMGKYTSKETLRIVTDLAKKIDKTPMVLTKDMNGAAMNRILSSINNEGLWALQNEEATKEEIDAAFYRAVNFNLGLTGTLDLVGLDVALDVGVILARAYGKRFGPPIRLVVNHVKAGRLGRKNGRGFNDWSKGHPHPNKNLRSNYDENRIYAVAINEFFWLVQDEMGDIKHLDTIVKLGFRMEQGIFEKAKSIGFELLFKLLNKLYKKYEIELYKPCPLFEQQVKNGLDKQ